MPDQEVTLTNEVGLHARPAALFSKAAAGYSSDVIVAKGDQNANAKSILAVLKLDVRKGDTISIRTEGDDADEALAGLVKLIEDM
jgi:phosphotransferase system HPr (HPr) family protein